MPSKGYCGLEKRAHGRYITYGTAQKLVSGAHPLGHTERKRSDRTARPTQVEGFICGNCTAGRHNCYSLKCSCNRKGCNGE